MVSISVVFPVHNEERNIKKLIQDWHLRLNTSNINHEGETFGSKANISAKTLTKFSKPEKTEQQITISKYPPFNLSV